MKRNLKKSKKSEERVEKEGEVKAFGEEEERGRPLESVLNLAP